MKVTIKRAVILLCVLLPVTLHVMSRQTRPKAGKEINIPMEPDYWKYDTANVQFIMQEGVRVASIKTGAPLVLKDWKFSNGTIEYDIALTPAFPGIYFRMSADRKRGDHFYLRYFGVTSPESRNTLQYAAVIDSLSIWDLTDEYQAGATLKIPGWNHIKLVVSGKQMKAYVNNMDRPALLVPALEGGTTEGGIIFSGEPATIANLVIRPDAVENLSPEPGYISTYNDTRYLRSWQVSPAADFPQGKEVAAVLTYMEGGTRAKEVLPDSAAQWTPLKAESRGIVNLTRVFGDTKNGGRRLAWLKTTIQSDRAQERVLHLGFNDEIWLFINGQILYTDKNHYGSPGQKFPRGRCTIENAIVRIPLKQGKNEILIGLANYLAGWGIIARLDDMDGVHLPADGR